MKRNSLLFLLLAALFMPLALHAQQSLPYSCGFEDGSLGTDGWTGGSTNEENSFGVMNNADYAHSGSCCFLFSSYEQASSYDQYLISPELNATSELSVEFYYYAIYAAYGTEYFEVGYSTTTNDDLDAFTWVDDIEADVADWVLYEGTFPAGTKYVAIHYYSPYQYYLLVDDFTFAVASGCTRPTDLAATNVGSRTATISWTSDASAWQICVNDDMLHLMNVNQTTYTFNSLTPETEYTVKVRTNCGNDNFSAWANVSFTTEVACPAPEDLNVADITATSANISWTSNNNNFQLRYRPTNAITYDFEDGIGDWTTIDADGDGFGWNHHINTGSGNYSTHSGDGCMVSASYDSNTQTALTPDNYLVSPQLSLGGSISFWACAQDGDWAAEHFGVAVSTTGNTNASDFTTIQEWTMTAKSGNRASGAYYSYTVDLSAYAGQTGYVAIRHFNCTDMFYLDVDDIAIAVSAEQPWITISNATNPQALTGLTPETNYEVEVQAVCGGQDGSSAWAYTTFTTLPSCIAPTDLTITNITTSSAMVTWTGSASSYNLKVNDQVYNNVNSPYYLRNLTAATVYTIEVQSVCSATSTSSWTSTEFVTEFCEEADKCELTFVLGDSYGDGWNGGYLDVIDVATNMSIANMAALDYGGGGQTYDTLTLAVCNGRNIRFAWHKGSWDSETSYTIYDINGDEIVSGSGYDFSNDAVISTYSVNCFSTCRKPTDFQVIEITANSVTLSWTENGEATAWVVAYTSGVRPQTVNATETTVTIALSPETYYTAKVRPVCDVDDKWSDEISFTTPATCPLPSDITIETGPESATFSWTGSTDSYNVRYRLATAAGFDDGTLGDWTTIDADGDGNTWYALDVIPGHNESAGLATSASYAGEVALTPDNYLVSPQVTLGGSISFYACAQDASWPSEHFGVAISTTGNTDATDFTTIAEWTMNADGTGTEGPAKAQGAWGLFTVDLSDYAGQTGYVAIRHFDCTDWFRLNVDDITIIQPGVENPWITLSTTETTITLSNLQLGTMYEYQMQSVCDGTPTEWSATNYFTTLGGHIFTTDGEWTNGNDWFDGIVPEEGSNVIIQANVTIPAGYTAIADQITIDGGSITIADGGQLRHYTEDLVVTMENNITPYTDANNQSNYNLIAFPFGDYIEVPETMTAFEGTDFYIFDNTEVGYEWRNNQAEAIDEVYAFEGYLYASPATENTLSLTGPTFDTPEYGYGRSITVNYDETENEQPGWRLFGNPYTCDAYIYGANGSEIFEMEVMYYDENGDMQTITCGPVPPMQGFFVKVTENTTVWFLAEPYDLSSKKGLQETSHVKKAITVLDKKMDKAAAKAISLDKKVCIVLDKTMVKKLASKDANNVKQFMLIKK